MTSSLSYGLKFDLGWPARPLITNTAHPYTIEEQRVNLTLVKLSFTIPFGHFTDIAPPALALFRVKVVSEIAKDR